MATKKGQIYKIHHSSDPNILYIGSTTKPKLIHRLQDHKSICKSSNLKNKMFEYFRQHNYDGFRISLLEEVEFKDRQDLRIAEDKWIRELKTQLNTRKAFETQEERVVRRKEYHTKPENKEKIATKKKEYIQKNKEAI